MAESNIFLNGKEITEPLESSEIIPFEFTKDEAIRKYLKWIKTKKFVPKIFKKFDSTKIHGIYVPYWIYDCDFNTDFIIICTDNGIDQYRISHKGVFSFRNVPVSASSGTECILIPSVNPFDYTKAEDFSSLCYPEYLYADLDISKDSAFKTVFTQMVDTAKQDIIKNINHKSISIEDSNCSIISSDAKSILLPVWFIDIPFKNRNYTIAINGQTGKINGFVPLSHAKLVFAGIGIAAGTLFILSAILNIILSTFM